MCGLCDEQQRKADKAARTFDDVMAQLSATLGGDYASGHYSDAEMVLEAIRRMESSLLTCECPAPLTLAEHTKHVERFLNEMYATMIDPVEQPKMTVAEMCEVLLRTAREQREQMNTPSNRIEVACGGDLKEADRFSRMRIKAMNKRDK